MTDKRINALLTAGSGLWCLAIVIAPLTGSRVIYEFFARICHQLPDRSWRLAGEPLPVCIRCASIYAGFFIATALRRRPNSRWLRIAIVTNVLEFLLAIAWIDFWPLRAAAGLLLGATVAPFVEVGVREMAESLRRRYRWSISS